MAMNSTTDIERYLQYNIYDLFGSSWDGKLVLYESQVVQNEEIKKAMGQNKLPNCLYLEYSYSDETPKSLFVFLDDECETFLTFSGNLGYDQPCIAKVDYMSGWEGFFFGIYTLFECDSDTRDFLHGLKECFDYMKENKVKRVPEESNKYKKDK